MAKKDDDIAGSYVPAPAHMPQRSGLMEAYGKITIVGSATMSATDAIVSVTPPERRQDMRAALDAFRAQLDALPPIERKLLAKGDATAENLGVKTDLAPDMTKSMAELRALDDELKESRQHAKELAQIEASGPYKAEMLKWALGIVGAVILALVSWYLGSRSGE